MEKERMQTMVEHASREELLNDIERAAHNYEKEYHGCSRCVFKALQDYLNLGDGVRIACRWGCHSIG